jgi:hypothetical protein
LRFEPNGHKKHFIHEKHEMNQNIALIATTQREAQHPSSGMPTWM